MRINHPSKKSPICSYQSVGEAKMWSAMMCFGYILVTMAVEFLYARAAELEELMSFAVAACTSAPVFVKVGAEELRLSSGSAIS